MPDVFDLPTHPLRLLIAGGVGDGTSTRLRRLLDDPKAHRRALVVGALNPEEPWRVVTGASRADLAIIVVDVRHGVVTDTRRHAYLASIAGIRDVVVLVSAIDLGPDTRAAFERIDADAREFAARIGIDRVVVIPASVLHGDNVLARSAHTPWYAGPTVLEYLDAVPVAADTTADVPTDVADQFRAVVVWTGKEHLLPGRPYLLTIGTRTVGATVTEVRHRINMDSLEHVAAKTLELDEIGVCNLSLDQTVPFDSHSRHQHTGGFMLVDMASRQPVGAGMIEFALRRSQNVHWQAVDISKQARSGLKGQTPCVLWFTGLSGSGKSTIANILEKKLHASGHHTYLLDGDNVRHGLNKDLGFTDIDRVENIRRVAEVARLMVDAGLITLVSFISPFRAERRLARSLLQPGEFCEVFVDTPLDVAERRDPKGLYRKARRGEIKNFTGIDSPYERPEAPEIRIDTTGLSAEEAADHILSHLQRTRVIR